MPIYSFKCGECCCEVTGMFPAGKGPEKCPECFSTESLEKMITNFSTKTESFEDSTAAGDLVKEKINEFSQELKKEKRQLSNRNYEP